MLTKSIIATATLLASASVFAAEYEVIEVETDPKFKQHFASSINDMGDVTGVARSSFNFRFYNEPYINQTGVPLRLDCGISQAELDSNLYDASSTSCLRTELARETRSNTGRDTYGISAAYQKVGDSKAFVRVSEQFEVPNLVDVEDESLGGITRSNNEYLTAINNNGIAVGTASAPYLPEIFESQDDEGNDINYKIWVREYSKKAIVFNNNQVALLEPEFATHGGVSSAFDINNNGLVAGFESVGLTENAATLIEEECDGVDYPVSVCVWAISVRSSASVFEIRPAIWQIDSNNDVVSKQSFGLAFTPSESQTLNYGAFATAINDNGIAVGYGDAPINADSNRVDTFPLIFKDGQTSELLENHNDYDAGFALDINNNNVVVGIVQKITNTSRGPAYKDSFFVYDIDANKFETPSSFYSTSQTVASAINDNGLVVGEGEYEVTNSEQRRKHGFIYDINSKEFNDVNDLIACQSPYEIVEIRDINNNNEIIGTALKFVDKRDSLGAIVKDSNGVVEKEQVTVAVVLKPVLGGTRDACPEKESTPYKRKGFSFNYWLILSLSFLVVMRRRFL